MSEGEEPNKSQENPLRELRRKQELSNGPKEPRGSWTGTVALILVVFVLAAILVLPGTRSTGHGATQSERSEREERMQQIEEAMRDAHVKPDVDDQSHAEPNAGHLD